LPTDDKTDNLWDIANIHNKYPDLPPIILGNFNANLANLTKPRDINIAIFMAEYQLRDPILIFKQKKNRSYTWRKKCDGRQLMTSRCDYIMTPFSQRIIDAKITCANPFDTDHYAVWVTLPGTAAAVHNKIKIRRTTAPNISPTNNSERLANCKLNILIQNKEKPTKIPTADARKRSWISVDTWKSIDRRHHFRRAGATKVTLNNLRREIKQKLERDWRERMAKLGERIKEYLSAKDYRKAWHTLWPFYKKQPRIFPLSTNELNRIGREFKELYQRTTPQGPPLRGFK